MRLMGKVRLRRHQIVVAVFITYIIIYLSFFSIIASNWTADQIDQSLQEEHKTVMSFLRGADEQIVPSMTINEWEHLADVRKLFTIAMIINVLAFGTLAGVWYFYNEQREELIIGSFRIAGISVLVICVVLGASIMLGFDQFWVLFHKVVFPQGNWQFPYDSLLITMYPSSFFFWFIVQLSARVCAMAAVLLAISYFMERMKLHEQAFENRKHKSARSRLRKK